jgi:hypothetical protein
MLIVSGADCGCRKVGVRGRMACRKGTAGEYFLNGQLGRTALRRSVSRMWILVGDGTVRHDLDDAPAS